MTRGIPRYSALVPRCAGARREQWDCLPTTRALRRVVLTRHTVRCASTNANEVFVGTTLALCMLVACWGCVHMLMGFFAHALVCPACAYDPDSYGRNKTPSTPALELRVIWCVSAYSSLSKVHPGVLVGLGIRNNNRPRCGSTWWKGAVRVPGVSHSLLCTTDDLGITFFGLTPSLYLQLRVYSVAESRSSFIRPCTTFTHSWK